MKKFKIWIKFKGIYMIVHGCVYKKLFIMVLALIANFYSFGAYAEKSSWTALSNNENSNYVEFSLNADNSLAGEIVKLSNNEIIYNKKLESKNYFSTLIKYFKLAWRNDTAAIASVYSNSDGSYERYLKNIVSIPDMFEYFADLQRIELNDVYFWGEYVVVTMNLIDSKTGASTKWIELLHCSKTCLVSDRLFHRNKESNFLSSLLPFMRKNNLTKSLDLNDESVATVLYNKDSSENPVLLRYKLNFFNVDKTSGEGAQKSKEKESFWSALTRKVTNSGDFILTNDGNEKHDRAFQRLNAFIESVKVEGKSLGVSLGKGAAHYNKLVEKSGEIFKLYCDRPYTKKLVQNYSFLNSENKNDDKEKNDLLDGFDGVKNYSNFALLQRILSWDSVLPYAYIVKNEIVYFWVKVTDKNKVNGVYIFAFDSVSNKLLTPDMKPAWRLLTDNLFAESLVAYLAESQK